MKNASDIETQAVRSRLLFTVALELRGLGVEDWLHSLSEDEGGELQGPTLGKIKQVMMVVLRHAEKYGHLPTGFATELGNQVSISNSSDYEAVILTPEQTMKILSRMRQPERTLTCGVEIAAAEFSPSYRRASIMQATLAAVGLISSIAAWLAGATFWWIVAGALLGSVIPFTLIAILPTNKQLLNPAPDRPSAHTGQLLARWGALHAVRSVLSALALLLLLYLLIFAKSQ